MAGPSFSGNVDKIVQTVAGTIGAGGATMVSTAGVAATWAAIVAAAPYVITGGAIAGAAYGIKKLLEDEDTTKAE